MSKADILAAIQRNKPALVALPEPFSPALQDRSALKERFVKTVNQIGAQVISVAAYADIIAYVKQHYRPDERVISMLPALYAVFESGDSNVDPHTLADVSLAIVQGHFGVAENAAVWLTEAQLGARVAPFICQHLAIVLQEDQLVEHMHEAYDRIGDAKNTFGVFIAGPSKTADIEQSLVIGAHGARSLLIFLVKE